MAKRKPRNPFTGRTPSQEAYHWRRQAQKRGTENRKRGQRLARSGFGCAIPASIVAIVAVAAIMALGSA